MRPSKEVSGAVVDDRGDHKPKKVFSRHAAVSLAEESYLREYSVGGIIRTTVKIYRRHFLALVVCCLVPGIPLTVLEILITSAMRRSGLTTLISLGTILVACYLALPLITLLISDICVGRSPKIRNKFGRISSSLIPLISTILIMLLFASFGFTFTVIAQYSQSMMDETDPSAIFFVLGAAAVFTIGVGLLNLRICLTLPALIIESQPNPLRGMRRSIELMRNHYWRNVGVLFLCTLLMEIITMLFSGIVTFVLALSIAVTLNSMTLIMITQIVISHLAAFLFFPISLIPIVLLYYDMRVRKEGFDRPTLASEIMS